MNSEDPGPYYRGFTAIFGHFFNHFSPISREIVHKVLGQVYASRCAHSAKYGSSCLLFLVEKVALESTDLWESMSYHWPLESMKNQFVLVS